jgi:tetratricopeptide (TPR) repeat protein
MIPFHFAEYRNASVSCLPFVDNFSAARNLSFSLATCDWQLWLDCDDLLTPQACAAIRACAEENAHDCYQFMYTKPDGSTCPRERLIRRGRGHWKNRIHETCVIASGDMCLQQDVVIQHARDDFNRESSHTRNLTLLGLTLDDAPRHYFYLHEELFWLWQKEQDSRSDPSSVAEGGPHGVPPPELLRRVDTPTLARARAIRTGEAALILIGDSKPDDIYEVLLNMSELQPERAIEHLQRAENLQPHRREALAYRSQRELRENHIREAVAWFMKMDALPVPDPPPWTHRSIWYGSGWARNYLRVKLLRAAGRTAEADADHARYLESPAYAKAVAEHEAAGAFEQQLAVAEHEGNRMG